MSLRFYYMLGMLLMIIGAILALVVGTVPNTVPAAITILFLMLASSLMAYVIGRLKGPA
jgi:multisubunit Na+/H+ antiporter MnhG subunit